MSKPSAAACQGAVPGGKEHTGLWHNLKIWLKRSSKCEPLDISRSDAEQLGIKLDANSTLSSILIEPTENGVKAYIRKRVVGEKGKDSLETIALDLDFKEPRQSIVAPSVTCANAVTSGVHVSSFRTDTDVCKKILTPTKKTSEYPPTTPAEGETQESCFRDIFLTDIDVEKEQYLFQKLIKKPFKQPAKKEMKMMVLEEKRLEKVRGWGEFKVSQESAEIIPELKECSSEVKNLIDRLTEEIKKSDAPSQKKKFRQEVSISSGLARPTELTSSSSHSTKSNICDLSNRVSRLQARELTERSSKKKVRVTFEGVLDGCCILSSQNSLTVNTGKRCAVKEFKYVEAEPEAFALQLPLKRSTSWLMKSYSYVATQQHVVELWLVSEPMVVENKRRCRAVTREEWKMAASASKTFDNLIYKSVNLTNEAEIRSVSWLSSSQKNEARAWSSITSELERTIQLLTVWLRHISADLRIHSFTPAPTTFLGTQFDSICVDELEMLERFISDDESVTSSSISENTTRSSVPASIRQITEASSLLRKDYETELSNILYHMPADISQAIDPEMLPFWEALQRLNLEVISFLARKKTMEAGISKFVAENEKLETIPSRSKISNKRPMSSPNPKPNAKLLSSADIKVKKNDWMVTLKSSPAYGQVQTIIGDILDMVCKRDELNNKRTSPGLTKTSKKREREKEKKPWNKQFESMSYPVEVRPVATRYRQVLKPVTPPPSPMRSRRNDPKNQDRKNSPQPQNRHCFIADIKPTSNDIKMRKKQTLAVSNTPSPSPHVSPEGSFLGTIFYSNDSAKKLSRR